MNAESADQKASEEAAVIPTGHIDSWFLSQCRDVAARVEGSRAVG